MRIASWAVLAILGLCAETAGANPLWSTVSAACAPAYSSTSAGLYTTPDGTVAATYGTFGSVFFCPITNAVGLDGSTVRDLDMVYYDSSDGTDDDTYVAASLVSMSLTSGDVTTLVEWESYLCSLYGVECTGDPIDLEDDTEATLDFEDNLYYVMVTVTNQVSSGYTEQSFWVGIGD